MPVGGVDHEDVDTVAEQFLRFRADIAVDAHRRADPKTAGGVQRRRIERRAQRCLAGHDADQPAGVDHRRGMQPCVSEQLEHLGQIGTAVDTERVPGHHLVQLGEPVLPGHVVFGGDADDALAVDDHDGAVCPLRDQGQGRADRCRRRQRDRGVVDRVPVLDPAHHLADHLRGDVLRDDGDPAAPRHRLSHPAAGDRRHVGDDHRDRRTHVVGGAQVDVQPGAD